MLVDCEDYSPAGAGLRNVPRVGGCARLLSIPFRRVGINGLYLHVEYPLAALSGLSRVYAVQMQAPEVLGGYGWRNDTCVLRQALRAPWGRGPLHPVSRQVLEVLSGSCVLPRYKISAAHLRHVSPREVKEMVQRHPGRLPRLGCLNHIMGAWGADLAESTFCTIAVYLLLLPDQHYSMLAGSCLWHEPGTPAAWLTVAKEVTVALKSLQHVVALDLTPLFELEVLLNRGFGAVDWAQERRNRTTELQVTLHPPEMIYREARTLFMTGRVAGRKPPTLEWEEFWARRWEWAAAGAVHSQYEEDGQYIPRDRDYRTKWHALSGMPNLRLQHWLGRRPETRAWPSTKFEWAKQRAIYGVDLTNYVLATYAFSGVEDTLPESCPLGSHTNEETIRQRVSVTVAGKSPFCLDFDDFNSQHSTTSMQAVLQAYLDVYRDELSLGQRAAGLWIVDALGRMIIHEPDSSCTYRAAGTLLSGWRLTTFVNTVLNYIYVHIAGKGLAVPTLHSGDDVLVGVDSYWQARALTTNLEAMGCRLQARKCFLGGLCEFLRVDHLHKSGGGGQYLARAVATVVHAPVETGRPFMLRAVLQAVGDRVEEVRRRQGDATVLATLELALLENVARIWGTTTAFLTQVMSAHKCVGGLAEGRAAPINVRYAPVTEITGGQAATSHVAPGAYAYAWELCSSLLCREAFMQVARQAARALELVAGRTRVSLTAQPLPKWIPEPAVLRERYGCKRTAAGFSPIKLLAGLGLPVRALRHDTRDLMAYYRQYPADSRLDWMAVTV